jgi:transmembrane sensor
MPLRVIAGSGRVRAIGTAFSVYLREDNGSIDITVSEGSIALEALNSTNTPGQIDVVPGGPAAELVVRELGTLQAGQVATISRLVDEESSQAEVLLSNTGSVEIPEMERRLSWTEGVLIFSGEPLEEVLREIGRYTTARIEFSDPGVGAIRVGGRFPVGETETMFETLEETFGLRVVQLSDNHVLVSAGD